MFISGGIILFLGKRCFLKARKYENYVTNLGKYFGKHGEKKTF
jgi:hypothetical protein